ncbi:MAG: hypothetical protein US53_C0062G0007 [Candidatus Woesebacteria bacterium GW2011_GWA1_37_7]|uniref:DUF5667 domain-containing protein n=1 Tax=Candidatus Woesebacteria bacterium GW2011_GWA1_37_7 TaxID=1618545 RepID=A0A0G0H205_9BACT|nr:MAG: hypothetical protein US53_C0062G0007 [Candidatus Woesebacteria bacterium GW2011_GWA1_37_7]
MKITSLNKLLIILVLLAIYLVKPLNTYAKNSSSIPEVSYESINPNNPYYPLKRVSEKTKIFFLSKFSPEKENRYILELLDRRMKEFIYISDNNDLTNFEKTAIRYNTTAGSLIDSQVKPESKDLEVISGYTYYLDTIKEKYEYASAYWLLTQQAKELTQQILNGQK